MDDELYVVTHDQFNDDPKFYIAKALNDGIQVHVIDNDTNATMIILGYGPYPETPQAIAFRILDELDRRMVEHHLGEDL